MFPEEAFLALLIMYHPNKNARYIAIYFVKLQKQPLTIKL